MKAIKVISVLALLVIFPAISYLYLIKGYNFRLEALEELEPKMKLESFDYPPVAELKDIIGRATIVFDADRKEAMNMLNPIYEEFSHRQDFQVFAFLKDSTKTDTSMISFQWRYIYEDYPFEEDLALIDTSGTIRNFYALDSVSFTSLGQHIPIIIPRKKDPDIVLKREDEK